MISMRNIHSRGNLSDVIKIHVTGLAASEIDLKIT